MHFHGTFMHFHGTFMHFHGTFMHFHALSWHTKAALSTHSGTSLSMRRRKDCAQARSSQTAGQRAALARQLDDLARVCLGSSQLHPSTTDRPPLRQASPPPQRRLPDVTAAMLRVEAAGSAADDCYAGCRTSRDVTRQRCRSASGVSDDDFVEQFPPPIQPSLPRLP
jgi:hypothetical protein